MSVAFATGKYALGICDRCGFTVKYSALKVQIINERESGLRVCPDCLDPDHPQWQVGKYPIYDPQALENPRPDVSTGATNVPQLVSYPVFNTNITPNTGSLGVTGGTPTVRLS